MNCLLDCLSDAAFCEAIKSDIECIISRVLRRYPVGDTGCTYIAEIDLLLDDLLDISTDAQVAAKHFRMAADKKGGKK